MVGVARRASVALAAGLVFLAPTSVAIAAPATGVDIQAIEVGKFPTVDVTISVSGTDDVRPEDIGIEENGSPVDDASIASLDPGNQRGEVVLVIDTSGSMLGAPLAAAERAAVDFVEALSPDTPVGIVTFSDDPHVALELTANHDRALQIIEGLEAAGETALYDAVVEASRLFSATGKHDMVILSDGGDTASGSTLRSAVSSIARSDASAFSVGLRTAETDPTALKAMAKGNSGRYQPVGTSDLSGVFANLATELTRQFTISFESKADAGAEIALTVNHPLGSDIATVIAPDSAPAARPSPRPDTVAPAIFQGTLALAVSLGLCFATVFVFLLMLLGGRERDQRRRRLAHVTATKPAPASGRSRRGLVPLLPDSLVNAGGRVAQAGGFSAALDRKLEQGGLKLRAGEFVAVSGVASLGGYFLGALLFRSIPMTIILIALCGATPYVFLTFAISRREKKLHEQLPDILGVLASCLRAGYSFLQALDTAAKEISNPGAEEFGRLIAEIRLGREVNEAMNAMADRVGSESFKWAVLAVNIQRQVGGNLAEVLDTVAKTLREREQVRRQVKALSAEGRLSMYILGALPFVIGAFITLINPEYIGLLYTTQVGLVMLITGACLLGLGFFWMNKVVKIDV